MIQTTVNLLPLSSAQTFDLIAAASDKTGLIRQKTATLRVWRMIQGEQKAGSCVITTEVDSRVYFSQKIKLKQKLKIQPAETNKAEIDVLSEQQLKQNVQSK